MCGLLAAIMSGAPVVSDSLGKFLKTSFCHIRIKTLDSLPVSRVFCCFVIVFLSSPSHSLVLLLFYSELITVDH